MNHPAHEPAELSEVQELLAKLGARNETVATAESCTGGLVATWLTHFAGSSAVYLGGVSSYANDAKIKLLGVSAETLARHGAVSAQTAIEMATGIRTRLGSTYAISITGIAGPGGGTADKPVGTVHCGVATPSGTRTVVWHLSGDRSQIRSAAARGALAELTRAIPD